MSFLLTFSCRSTRALPIPRIGKDDAVVNALRTLHDLQQIEASAAMPAYESSCYLVADELG